MLLAAWCTAMFLPLLHAHEANLTEALSGAEHPLSIPLKEFSAGWRRLSIQSGGVVRDNVSVNVNGNTSGGSTSQNNIAGAFNSSRAYLTKGQTIAAGGQTYLIAYHLPSAGLDLGTLLQALATKAPPSMNILTPETALPLTLLHLQAIGSLEDIRPFDLSSEINESERALKAMADLFKSQSGGASTNAPTSTKNLAPPKSAPPE